MELGKQQFEQRQNIGTALAGGGENLRLESGLETQLRRPRRFADDGLQRLGALQGLESKLALRTEKRAEHRVLAQQPITAVRHRGDEHTAGAEVLREPVPEPRKRRRLQRTAQPGFELIEHQHGPVGLTATVVLRRRDRGGRAQARCLARARWARARWARARCPRRHASRTSAPPSAPQARAAHPHRRRPIAVAAVPSR